MDDEQPAQEQHSSSPQEAMKTPRSSFVSKEEELLQDATQDMQTDTPAVVQPVQMPKGKRSFKKPLGMLFALVILAGLGVGAWKILAKKSSSAGTSTTAQSSAATNPQTTSNTPNTIAYAFRLSSGDAYTAYWRPAAGGDRKEALVGFSKTGATYSDVRGSNIVFTTEDALYASTDSGKNYKKLLTLKAGEQVTSLRLSTDGAAVAYGFLAEVGGKNTVKSMDLQGKSLGDLFIADSPGVFIYQWNKSLQKVFYTAGCYNCDGNVPGDTLRDLKTNKTTNPVTKGQKLNLVSQPVISDDFSTIVYIEGQPVVKTTAALGNFADPPYKVNVLSVNDGSVTTAATVGQKDATNPNGTPKEWSLQTGFVAGTSTPYYASEGTVYSIKGDMAQALVPTGQIIQSVYFVNADTIVLSTVKDSTTTDFDLQTVNVSTKKNTLLLQGDTNTTIFGVTTK